MEKSQKPNVYAFIDSQNLNVSTQKFGWKMDWRKFRQFLDERFGVTKAFMFIGYMPENEELYEQMHEAGYMVVLKPTFDLTRAREVQPISTAETPVKEEDKKPVKGNIDADLVLWAMKELNSYDKAIIVSGDGDFYSLVEYLVEQGKLLHLLAPSGHYSQLYNHFESYIVRLDTFRRQLSYRGFRRR
jgi:uncharacterized LabA/DUF88 family protein